MKKWWHRFTGGCLLSHQWVDADLGMTDGATKTRSVCQKCGKRLITLRKPGEYWRSYEEQRS